MFVYPLDLARVRMTADLGVSSHHRGLVDCLRHTVRTGGLRAAYRGLTVSVAEIAPYSGIAYGLNAYLKEQWLHEDVAQQSTVKKLGIGVVAGGCASMTMYPIDTMRRRLMLDGARGFKSKYTGLYSVFRITMREEGFRAFYRGAGVNLIKACPDAAITFYSFDLFRRYFSDTTEVQ